MYFKAQITICILSCPRNHFPKFILNYYQNLNVTVNVLKFQMLNSILFLLKICFFTLLFFKILSGLANCVDPDQTVPSGAVCSGSSLFVIATLLETLMYKILGHLPYLAL